MANKIGVLAKKATGGASDVTPNAVNWSNIEYNGTEGYLQCTEKQITGINTSITLNLDYAGTVAYMYGGVFSSQQLLEGSPIFDPYTYGLNDIGSGGSITVSNNQWVVFCAFASSNGAETISVKNQSDGSAVIDTFTVTGFGIP